MTEIFLIITPTRVWIPLVSSHCKAVNISIPLIMISIWNVSQRLMVWRLDSQCTGLVVRLQEDTCIMTLPFVNGLIPFSDVILVGGENLEVRSYCNEWSRALERFRLSPSIVSLLTMILSCHTWSAALWHTFAFCGILPHHRSITVGSKWLTLPFPLLYFFMGCSKIGIVSPETSSCEMGGDCTQALWSPVDSTLEQSSTSLLM